jgi:hypothetical protein
MATWGDSKDTANLTAGRAQQLQKTMGVAQCKSKSVCFWQRSSWHEMEKTFAGQGAY